MKNKLLIIGAGGHGKVVANIASLMGCWEMIYFLDDNEQINEVNGFAVIDRVANLEVYVNEYDIFVAIGNNKTRRDIHEKLLELKASIPILIHPNTIVEPSVIIGCGTVIMAGVVICIDSKIGKACIINTSSSIDHDNEIKDFVHVSPGCTLSGNVTIGNTCWLCTGSKVINNIFITDSTIIGAGAVVTHNVYEPGSYIGIPARRKSD